MWRACDAQVLPPLTSKSVSILLPRESRQRNDRIFEQYSDGRTIKLKRLLIPILAALCVTLPAMAGPEPLDHATRLIDAGKPAEAALILTDWVGSKESDGAAWIMLGRARLDSGDATGASAAFEKAFALRHRPYEAAYHAGVARSIDGDGAGAYDWIRKAVRNGFRDTDLIRTEPMLANLQADDGFEEFVTKLETQIHPCWADDYRGLDFWLGEWGVTNTNGGKTAGRSSIQLHMDKCVVVENWYGGTGWAGKSFNVFEKSKGTWRQTWSDSSGRIYDFVGEASENQMVYTRKRAAPQGKEQTIRMTLSKLESGEVRQLSEISEDSGQTWKLNYDFTYTRISESTN